MRVAARYDLKLDANGDLPIDATGVMPVAPSDLQHQRDMFVSFPGEWKQFLSNGVGVPAYLKSTNTAMLELKSKARQALQKDGYNVGNLQILDRTDNGITINTNATR